MLVFFLLKYHENLQLVLLEEKRPVDTGIKGRSIFTPLSVLIALFLVVTRSLVPVVAVSITFLRVV